jgi:hypothetical protein
MIMYECSRTTLWTILRTPMHVLCTLSMAPTLYQERAVFGKMKMDPAKRAQTQNAGEVSSLQWFFSQSIELMMEKVWLHCDQCY